MTQVIVSIVYVFPTLLFQMNRHLSQKASKTGRKQVMSALTPMRAVNNTNFKRKRRLTSLRHAAQAMASVQDYKDRQPSNSIA